MHQRVCVKYLEACIYVDCISPVVFWNIAVLEAPTVSHIDPCGKNQPQGIRLR